MLLRTLRTTEPANEETKRTIETIKKLIELDEIFTDDFDDMIQAIERMCTGVNLGLDKEFYKLREKFFYLQTGVYRDAIPDCPQHGRDRGEHETPQNPNIIDIIKLFNKKADVLTQMAQYFHSDKYTHKSRDTGTAPETDTEAEDGGTRNARTHRTPSKQSKTVPKPYNVNGNKLVFRQSSIPNPDLTNPLIQNLESLDLSDLQLDLNEEFGKRHLTKA